MDPTNDHGLRGDAQDPVALPVVVPPGYRPQADSYLCRPSLLAVTCNDEAADLLLAAWAFLIATLHGTQHVAVSFTSIVQDETTQDANLTWYLGPERTAGLAVERSWSLQEYLTTAASTRQSTLTTTDGVNGHGNDSADAAPSSLLVLPAASTTCECRSFTMANLTGDYPYALVIAPPGSTHADHNTLEALFDEELLSEASVANLLTRFEEVIRAFQSKSHSKQLTSFVPVSQTPKGISPGSPSEEGQVEDDDFKQGELGQIFTELLSDILDIPEEDVSSNSTFVSLGGNSLDAMKLVVRLQSRGFRLSVADVFQQPTLGAMMEKASRLLQSEDEESVESDMYASQEIRASIAAQCNVSLRDIEDAYPATPFQEATLALMLRDPGAFVTSRTFHIAEGADLTCLKAAWQAVTAANPILRTRFCYFPEHGMLQAVVSEDIYWVERPFDDYTSNGDSRMWKLGNPCLMVEAFGADCVRLTMHHAIYDGWSLRLVFEDLNRAYYERSIISRPSYKVFSEYVRSLDLENSKAYWKDYLADSPSNPFPDSLGLFNQQSFHCSEEVKDSLPSSVCTSSIATPATLVTAAWAMVVSRYSGTEDICFGHILSGRTIPLDRVDAIVGPLVSTVPLRVHLARTETVGEYLRKVQRNTSDAASHACIGLQNIRKVSNAARQACTFGHLFQVHPSGEHFSPSTVLHLPDTQQDESLSDYTTYPLHVSCTLDAESVSISLRFDPTILSHDRIDQLLTCFHGVLDSFASVEERTTLADVWRTPILVPKYREPPIIVEERRLVTDMIETQTQSSSEAMAICSWDLSVTYGQMRDLTRRLSQYLVSTGVGPGVCVCFALEKSCTAIIAILATLLAGGACVPLDILSPASRSQRVINKCQPRIILCSGEQETGLREATATQIFVLDSDTLASLPSADDFSPPVTKSNDMCYVMFTSGSTGEPKGCVWDSATLSTALVTGAAACHISRESRMLQFASFIWDISVIEILGPLIKGGCVCVPSETVRMNSIFDFTSSSMVNTAWFTPTVARSLKLEGVGSLQTLTVIGEMVDQALIERYRKRLRFIGAYGPTECCILVAAIDFTSCGTSNVNGNIGYGTSANMWIVDCEDPHVLLPENVVGEILIQGPGVGPGYLKDAVSTSAAFLHDLDWDRPKPSSKVFYRSGDKGLKNKDGSVTFVGRKDSQVKVRGQRLELGEVEYRIHECEGVQHAMAFVSAEHPHNGGLAAIVSFREAIDTLDDGFRKIKQQLASVLPPYAVPELWLSIERAPTTAAGKLDRSRMKQMALEMLGRPDSVTRDIDSADGPFPKESAPTTRAEEILQAALAETLQVAPSSVRLEQSFSQLGGDSIQAIKLVSLLRLQSLSLTVLDAFRSQTVRQMASCMSSAGPNDTTRPFSQLDKSIDLEDLAELCGLDADDIVDAYPATPMQEGVMTLASMRPGTYVARFAFRVDESVTERQLKEAWKAVEEATPILRTRIIHSFESGSYQLVTNCDLPWEDADDLTTYLSKSSVTMDFGEALVLPALVGQHLILTIHHAAFDNFTLRFVLEDLTRACRGEISRERPAFREFIGYLNKTDWSTSEQFWKYYLEGTTCTTNFPQYPSVDYRPRANKVEKLRVHFSSEQLPTTIATFANAAFALLLATLSDMREVVYGTNLTGRDAPVPGIATMCGPTLATVPVKVSIDSASATVEPFLQEMQTNLLSVSQHQHFGLQSLRGLNESARIASTFKNLLIVYPLDNTEPSSSVFQPVETGTSEQHAEAVYFDTYPLSVIFRQMADGAEVAFVYDEELFDRPTLRRTTECFEHIFQNLVKASPDLSVGNITASPIDTEDNTKRLQNISLDSGAW